MLLVLIGPTNDTCGKRDAQRLLTAPRSAQQYGCDSNGADAGESPLTLLVWVLLEPSAVPSRLDRGIYINNLWYLNYSDRLAGRITSMTRFGCFWVEDGQLQCPIEVLRFDDSLYRMLGSELEALTTEAEVQIKHRYLRCTFSGKHEKPWGLNQGNEIYPVVLSNYNTRLFLFL